MGIIIESGTGDGNSAGVTAGNALMVSSINRTIAHEAAHNGENFRLASDLIALTSAAGEVGMMYFQYTGTSQIHISTIRVSSNVETKWRLYLSPTATGLTETQTIVNSNAISGKVLTATAYKAAASETDGITGGNLIGQMIQPAGVYHLDPNGGVILGTNDTLALTAELTSNGTVGTTWEVFLHQNGHTD